MDTTPTAPQAAQPLSYEPRPPRRRRPFIAGVIVGLILGVLLAAMLPEHVQAVRYAIWWHLQGGKETVQQSSAMSQLQTLRSQLELYKLQHGDNLPNLPQNWDPLVKTSTYQGQRFGPYLQAPVTNPFNGRSNVIGGDTTKPATRPCGFIFDYRNGAGTGAIVLTDKDGRTPAPF